jgi:NAD-dependent SIR2 family protein deacetylase
MLNAELVQCTKCQDVHQEAARTRRSDEEFEKKGCTPMVCPQCGHDTWSPPVSVTHDSHEQSDIQSA